MDSYLSAADYRLGYLPCCGWSGPRERGILSTKPTRRRLLAAQARPLWPMRVQLLGTHQQTNLWWEGSLQPLLQLPAHHQRLSQAGTMLTTAHPRRRAGRIGVGRSEH